MRILVIEDDPLLGDALQAGLRQRGFDTDWVKDGIAAQAALRSQTFEAAVLDLGLPGLDGSEVLRSERARGSVLPVLVLTARDTAEDRRHLLDMGADDYVVKPVDLDELAARLRALRRSASGRCVTVLEVGDWLLDQVNRTVTYRGAHVELSASEHGVLQQLLLNVGRVLSREQIAARLTLSAETVEGRSVDVHIDRLRIKLGPDAIRTVHGVGYLIMARKAQHR